MLLSALQSRDPFVRIHAAQVLKRHDVEELHEQLVMAARDEYVSVVWDSIKWEEKKVENKPEIIPIALRWAEFLTRGEKNERHN